MNQNPQNYPPTRGSGGQTDDTSVMSVGQWVVTYLVMMIPCIGLIMTIVWAASSTGNLNRRNYCRAYLILIAVILVLTVILFAVMFAVMGTAFLEF